MAQDLGDFGSSLLYFIHRAQHEHNYMAYCATI